MRGEGRNHSETRIRNFSLPLHLCLCSVRLMVVFGICSSAITTFTYLLAGVPLTILLTYQPSDMKHSNNIIHLKNNLSAEKLSDERSPSFQLSPRRRPEVPWGEEAPPAAGESWSWTSSRTIVAVRGGHGTASSTQPTKRCTKDCFGTITWG